MSQIAGSKKGFSTRDVTDQGVDYVSDMDGSTAAPCDDFFLHFD
jgi:hypothetical protein